MRKLIYAFAFLLGAISSPLIAQAEYCPVAHTFTTGETLTQTTLNANPVQFSSCISNLDYSNINSYGIYASQIIPISSVQATFGGSQKYTFPESVTYGSLGTYGGTLNASDGSIVLNMLDGGPGFAYNSNNGSNQTNIAESVSAGYPYFSIAKMSAGGGSFQNWLVGIDSSLNFNVPNGNIKTPNNFAFGDVSTGGTLNGSTGNVSISGSYYASGSFKQVVSSTTYQVPFDAQSHSESANTHIEHGNLTTGDFSSGYACAASTNFAKSFTSTPDIVFSPINGMYPTSYGYINSRSSSAFQVCYYLVGQNSGTITFSWMALGE